MPQQPQHPCNHPGCQSLTRGLYCDRHRRERRPSDRRPSAHRRGYTGRWRKASKQFLADHPWCAECGRQNLRQPAALVDHITPHKGNQDLFWDETNWQPLCKRCHDRKTAREDGGFGRPPSL